MGAMTETSRMQNFPTPTPPQLRVDIPRGRIRILASETGETSVRLTAIHGDAAAQAMIADAEVAQNGDEIVVRIRKAGFSLFGLGGAVEAEIHAPLDSGAVLTTGSGRIETSGRLGQIDATTGSGPIRLDALREARARTGSGDIDIASATGSVDVKAHSGRIVVGPVGGHARISTASGHAELECATGDARLRTASGNIEVGRSGDSLDAVAASGNVRVWRTDHGRVRAKCVSGQVSVGVAKGAAALLDISTVSGRVHSELEAGGPPGADERQVELVLSTVSGNVNLTRV
jgi:hypothetical protein